ncbi:MAG: acyl-CoA-binding protein [Caldilineales bacterium]|nr:acyl-CoA-binding protein [Caldilineales bacterium]
MSDLQTQFEAAAAAAQQLPKRPDNNTLLKLYALYKQATAGDVAGKKPGFTDPVGRAKYDAWTKLKGTGQDSAMQQYIDLVAELQSS